MLVNEHFLPLAVRWHLLHPNFAALPEYRSVTTMTRSLTTIALLLMTILLPLHFQLQTRLQDHPHFQIDQTIHCGLKRKSY